MGKHWNEEELDAFGHLNWTVGNEDWIACFDAILKGDKIEYHVVVDCESGGFVGTMENGSVDIDSAVTELIGLPEQYFGLALEQYAEEDMNNPESPYYLSENDTEKTKASWKEHLAWLQKTAQERR